MHHDLNKASRYDVPCMQPDDLIYFDFWPLTIARGGAWAWLGVLADRMDDVTTMPPVSNSDQEAVASRILSMGQCTSDGAP